MRKGFEWNVNVLFMLVLFFVAVGVLWYAINPVKAGPSESEPTQFGKSCNSDDDCLNHPDGAKCLVIYPGDFTAFCGCLTNEDCINRENGICGSDNKCT